MSGSTSVTVPGATGLVTVALGTGDVLHLASTIGALLSTIQGAGHLALTTASLSSIPPAPGVSSPTVTDLNITGAVSGGSATVPSGYSYVVDVNTLPSTLTASGGVLITGTAGGSFYVSGVDTVAATGGNNYIQDSGTYLISTGNGNETVNASGYGTVATDLGNSAIFLSGYNTALSIGQDTVVTGVGQSTVYSSGSNSDIVGGTAPGGLLYVSLTGAGSTVSTFDSDTSVTVAGSGDIVGGGIAASNFVVTGTADTIIGGSGPETVSATSSPVIFDGTGPLSFIGGAGTATIVGTPGGTEAITVGAGGVLFSANASNAGSINTSTITSGMGATTVFGAPDGVVNFVGSLGGGVFLAYGGNETLNAAGSSTSNLFSAGSLGGSASLVGGSGNDTILAGNGSTTMSGGAGSNAFAFFDGSTGGHDYITDFSSTDSLFLIGYASTQSAASLLSSATVGPTGVTLTLSDSTQITFTNLTSTTPLNNDILYAQKPQS